MTCPIVAFFLAQQMMMQGLLLLILATYRLKHYAIGYVYEMSYIAP